MRKGNEPCFPLKILGTRLAEELLTWVNMSELCCRNAKAKAMISRLVTIILLWELFC